MASSSYQTQKELQQEIKARISSESPTKYDVDFYKRKINRLQNDFNTIQDQLNKARVRLRRAEDFQLKYELILKQNSNLLSDLDQKERQCCQKKSQNEHLRTLLQEKSNKGEDLSKERLEFQRQIEKWKIKAEESEQKRITFMMEAQEKNDSNQKRQLEFLKKDFSEREESLQFQIRQLKKTIHEKENIEIVVSSRVDKIRTEKDSEIQRIQEYAQKQKLTSNQALKEKNQEIEKLREKFEKIFNFEIENLKKSLDDQDELFSIQLNGFREMIGIKNDQIGKLLRQIQKQYEEHQQEQHEFNRENNMLKEKIYTIERENQLELYNIKERLTKLHAADIEAIEKRYTEIIEGLKTDRKDFERILKEKDKMVEGEKRQYDRMKSQMHDKLKERDTRIEHLQERIKESGDMNDNQMKNLHQSFHQIESEKQLMVNDYQTNVGFLNQQLSKLNVKNQTMSSTIKQLHEQIVRIKKDYTQNMLDLELKWKEQRKEYEEEKQHARQRYEKLQDDQRERDRQAKAKEKQLERLREKEEREKVKLQFIIEEMERDTERLNLYIKQMDESLKRQLKKNQISTLDTGGIRRQLNSELERQKSQLEAIKRMEVDQAKKKHQIELTRITLENQKLQTNLLNKTISLENLEEEFKKLQHVNKNIDKINKEKLIEYQKKVATLNNQINLTQNLYQNFLDAKARVDKKENRKN